MRYGVTAAQEILVLLVKVRILVSQQRNSPNRRVFFILYTMISETLYSRHDLESGVCESCGEYSDEILKGDGRCIDCIETELFYEMTMRMKPDDD